MWPPGTVLGLAEPSSLPGYEPPPPVPAWRQLAVYARGLADRRPRQGSPGFLILAQGRSGSELLVGVLNASPDVHCDGEILERRVAYPTAWAEARRRRHRDRFYGFKVKPLHLMHTQRLLDMELWLVAMRSRGWRIVHLERRNLVRQVLSNMAAERGVWHRRSGPSRPTREALQVDPAVLIHWVAVRARWREQERAALAGLPHQRVSYEDDLLGHDRQQATLDRLTASLGVRSGTVATTLRPTNPGRLADLVANYHEVRLALEGSPWEAYLDSP